MTRTNRNRPDERRERRNFWLGLAALALACVASFAPALRGGLIWDDRAMIGEDPRIRGLDQIGRIFRETFQPAGGAAFGSTYYRPLTTLSFALDYARGGAAPAAFHQTNLLLHVLATLAAFLLLRRWLGRGPAALLAALVLAVHPSRTESVCWITGRTDLLSGLFVFVSLLLAGLWAEERRRWALPAALAALALGMLAKESAIVVPPLLALWFGMTADAPSPAARWRAAAARSAPFFALAAVFLLLWWRLGVLGGPRPHTFDAPPQRLLYAAQTLARYDALALWPHGFHLIATSLLPEGLRYHPLPAGAPAVAGIVAAAAATVSAWWWARRDRTLAFCLAAWPVALLPALNIVPLPAVAGLRLLYAPLLFLVAALALAWRAATARLSGTAGLALRAGAPLAVVLALGAVSFDHCLPWRNEDSFWAYHLQEAPDSANVQFFAGATQYAEGRSAAALPYLEAACRLSPDNSLFLIYAGNALLDLQRYPQAEQVFRHALQVDPGDGTPADRLGVALADQGRAEEARARFAEALAISPGNAGFHADLGLLLLRQREAAGAARELEAALRIDPRLVPAYGWLALAYDALGDRQRALATAGRGLAIAPGEPGLRAVIGRLQGGGPPR